MKTLVLVALVLAVLPPGNAHSCTIVMVSDGDAVLAGSNEDSMFPLTMLWYVPATRNDHARVCLGYNMMVKSVQGGMNDAGLFVDGNSLGGQGWNSDPDKTTLMGSVLDRLLATCSDIEEVKAFFGTYNVQALDVARIPVMDRTGASIIVEWYDGQVVFLEADESFQVATNFTGSKFIDRDKTCWRYNKAVDILAADAGCSVDGVRDVLDATHVEDDRSTTVYSFICDLKAGEIHVYNYHDFTTVLTFDLADELRKGAQEYYLGQLFTGRAADYEAFLETGPVGMIERGYGRGVPAALMFFTLLRAQYPNAFGREIGVETLSVVGMNLVAKGELTDAATLLERNADEFPDSARAHFELGEVYLELDDRKRATAAFEKALDVDPNHAKAASALKDLSQ